MIDRRKFIKCSLAMASMASLGVAGIYKFQNEKINFVNSSYCTKVADLKWGNIPHLMHFEIHATDHCNLNCKYCDHYSSVAREWYYDIKKLERDLERISYVTNKKVTEIQILGGEPLLHPQINSFFKLTRKYFPYSRIGMLTNGILLDSMHVSFWKSLNKYNIELYPSIYPIKINWQSILKKVQLYNIYFANDSTHKPVELENIDFYTTRKFSKRPLNLAGNQDINKYYKCKKRKNCNNYREGKLYPCPSIANVHILNEKYSINLPVTEEDYIDIYKVNKIEEIIDFMQKPKPFCKYCAICPDKTKQPSEPWACSKEHSLSEWTV